jgi:hypothetical protein
MRYHSSLLPVLTSMLLLLFISVGYTLLDAPVEVARGKSAAIPLSHTLTDEQELAQTIALADARVQAYTVGQRTEVFGVAHYLDVNTPISRAGCTLDNCRIVNIFNFDASATIQAFVRLDTQTVVEVYYQAGIRPGINRRLADRAMEIALNEPTVVEIIGQQRTSSDWAPMDSTLVGSACEAGHMCVAPTFDMGDYILWAIVDLTDDRFVDTFWTATDGLRTGPVPYPDAYDTLTPQGCPEPGIATRNGWVVNYNVTGTDGLRVSDVTYNNAVVIRSGKLVEWHVDYGGSGFQDIIGCGGSGGGFLIYPYGDTHILDLTNEGGDVIGFEVVQDFRQSNWGANCNYRYEQRFQFYTDGRFRTVQGAFGKGCGVTSTYRGLMRLDLAMGGTDSNDTLATWNGSAWQNESVENRWCPEGESHASCVGWVPGSNPDGYRFRITDSQTNSGYYVEPGRGQFDDEGQGDFEFVYALAHHPDEGDEDLGIFAVGCCNDYTHGPEEYMNGENINDSDLVLWYLPQMATDGVEPDYYCWTVTGEPNPETYPCFGGPMFVPFGEVVATVTPSPTSEVPPTATATATTTAGTPTPTATPTGTIVPPSDFLYLPWIWRE